MGQHQDQLTTSNIGKMTQANYEKSMRIDDNLDENECVAPSPTSASASAPLKQNRVPFKAKLVWINIILYAILHSSIPISLYLIYTQRPWKTLIFSILAGYAAFLGVLAGSHRLWSHRSYKAKWPVQVLLCLLQTMAGQNSIYTWARDHRMHHKYQETDADPHNIKRGFFFAHMGWLCCRKHPELKEKGKSIDMSDLESNPYVMFQHRHFWLMALVFMVLVPTILPVLLWNERFWTSLVLAFMIRYLLTLHSTFVINSVAHYYGHRPYDNRIEARNSTLAIWLTMGEGFHNFHHTFPYDYAASEFGRYINFTTAFIDLCAALGLVYGRRKADIGTIVSRRARTGDLTEMEGKIDERDEKGQQGEHNIKSSLPVADAAGQENGIEGSNSTGGRVMLNCLTLSDNRIYKLHHISGLTDIQCTPCA